MGIRNSELSQINLFNGKDDPTDYGLKDKIKAITTPNDPAIDLTAKLK